MKGATKNSKSINNINGSTVLMVSFFILLVVTPSFVSARYLPTRSDNSKRERIKEVLRLLLELSNGNDNDLHNMDSFNYGSNVLPISFSPTSTGSLGYEYGDSMVKPSNSNGLTKRSISPVINGDMS